MQFSQDFFKIFPEYLQKKRKKREKADKQALNHGQHEKVQNKQSNHHPN